MKKYLLSMFLLPLFCSFAFAGSNIANSFVFGSGVIKDDLFFTSSPEDSAFSWGAGGGVTNVDAFKDYVYNADAMLGLKAGFASVIFKPFYYFENEELDAAGASLNFAFDIKKDEVKEIYAHTYISAAYMRQNALVARAGSLENEEYDQAAVSLSIKQNFFNTFYLIAGGSAHIYPSGISDIEGIRGIADQNKMADLDTYAPVLGLPKYSAGLKFVRALENGANIYVSYRFVEMYREQSFHTAKIGNQFPIGGNIWADIGYNHVLGVDDGKSDYLMVSLTQKF